MPALNIEFTDAEIARLRERALAATVSMKSLAHDTIIRAATQDDEDAAVMAAYERIRGISGNLLRRLSDRRSTSHPGTSSRSTPT
ncbi:MAG: hypothetical protein ACRDNZ_06180 [Streptosporangiaceae bacterium]